MGLVINIDGGSRGNPGPGGAGVLIRDADTGESRHAAGYFLGSVTNNVAEYQGLIRSLQAAAKLDTSSIAIRSDSQLMVRQILGQYRVKSPDLKPLYQQATQLLKRFGRWQIQHVCRHDNEQADQLANRAMDAKGDVIVVPLPDQAGCDDPTQDPVLQGPGNATDVTAAASRSTPATRDSANLPGQLGDPADNRASQTWRVELPEGQGPACPMSSKEPVSYRLGPATDAGMCIYAAQAALQRIIGPAAKSGAPSGLVRCDHCGASIQVTPL